MPNPRCRRFSHGGAATGVWLGAIGRCRSMGVTHVSAAARDARRATEAGRRPGERHLVLVMTSVVAVLAIGLSYGGRLAAQRHAESSQQAARLTNLNVVTDSRELEPLFGPIFTNPLDRRFAAERVLEFILSVRSAGDSLPNVGAILGARASADAIQRAPVVAYKERLQQALEKATATGGPPPVSLPVLTSSELAQLKPSVVVRTDETFSRLTLLCAAVYLASIWAVPLFWWARGFRGDYLLLSATHLLTALGFAVLLSRQDPLRDTLLFVRYTQGVSIGLVDICRSVGPEFPQGRVPHAQLCAIGRGALPVCDADSASAEGPAEATQR